MEKLIEALLGFEQKEFLERCKTYKSHNENLEEVKKFLDTLVKSCEQYSTGDDIYLALYENFREHGLKAAAILYRLGLKLECLAVTETDSGERLLYQIGDCYVVLIDSSWGDELEYIVL